jgi:Skp family chaperone for outer membrane proteins
MKMRREIVLVVLSIGCFCGITAGITLFYWKTEKKEKNLAKEFSIAIVDGDRLKKEALLCLKIEEIIQTETDRLQAYIQKEREELKNLSDKKKDTQIPLSKRAEYRRQYDGKLSKIVVEVNQKRQNLKQLTTQLQELANTTVTEVAQKLAKKYHLRILLNATVVETMAVLYASPAIDLTNEAIQMIDEQIPNFDIEKKGYAPKKKSPKSPS